MMGKRGKESEVEDEGNKTLNGHSLKLASKKLFAILFLSGQFGMFDSWHHFFQNWTKQYLYISKARTRAQLYDTCNHLLNSLSLYRQNTYLHVHRHVQNDSTFDQFPPLEIEINMINCCKPPINDPPSTVIMKKKSVSIRIEVHVCKFFNY